MKSNYDVCFRCENNELRILLSCPSQPTRHEALFKGNPRGLNAETYSSMRLSYFIIRIVLLLARPWHVAWKCAQGSVIIKKNRVIMLLVANTFICYYCTRVPVHIYKQTWFSAPQSLAFWIPPSDRSKLKSAKIETAPLPVAKKPVLLLLTTLVGLLAPQIQEPENKRGLSLLVAS